MTIRAARPADFSDREIEDFIAFVREGGEVNPATLPALVDRATLLVTRHEDGNLIGTAAIKRPHDNHRRGEFAKAGVAASSDAFPGELGWIVVQPAHRRKGIARSLVDAAIRAVSELGIYSTTKSDQMRRMLPEFGFVELGQPYPSALDHDAMLTLFGRVSPSE